MVMRSEEDAAFLPGLEAAAFVLAAAPPFFVAAAAFFLVDAFVDALATFALAGGAFLDGERPDMALRAPTMLSNRLLTSVGLTTTLKVQYKQERRCC